MVQNYYNRFQDVSFDCSCLWENAEDSFSPLPHSFNGPNSGMKALYLTQHLVKFFSPKFYYCLLLSHNDAYRYYHNLLPVGYKQNEGGEALSYKILKTTFYSTHKIHILCFIFMLRIIAQRYLCSIREYQIADNYL